MDTLPEDFRTCRDPTSSGLAPCADMGVTREHTFISHELRARQRAGELGRNYPSSSLWKEHNPTWSLHLPMQGDGVEAAC